jgi:hypothetical protein
MDETKFEVGEKVKIVATDKAGEVVEVVAASEGRPTLYKVSVTGEGGATEVENDLLTAEQLTKPGQAAEQAAPDKLNAPGEEKGEASTESSEAAA